MKKLTSRLSFLSLGILLFCGQVSAQNAIRYQLLKEVTIGGQGGWDFLTVDAENRTLYIAHATQVETYNLDRDSVMAPILNTEGAHGIAIADRERHGFISCGKSNTVLEFGLLKRDTIQRIAVGEKPDAITYDYASHHVFVMNAGSNNITVLDASTGASLALIALDGNPESAISDDRGYVYVNIESTSEIAKINSSTNTVEAVWKLAPGEGPTALTMDRGSNRLFAGCANQKMIVMNATSGKITQTFPIGKGVDAADFDPFTKLAFSANGEGNVTILRETTEGKYKLAQKLETKKGARNVGFDPTTHDIYLTTADLGPAPAPTKDKPKPKPSIIPGTFAIFKYGQIPNPALRY
jgi:YVTN family beta-propeller protein